jgi:hypothetical protein
MLQCGEKTLQPMGHSCLDLALDSGLFAVQTSQLLIDTTAQKHTLGNSCGI